jgi:hypothetical protein
MKFKTYLLSLALSLGLSLSACGGTLELGIEATPDLLATQGAVQTQVVGTATAQAAVQHQPAATPPASTTETLPTPAWDGLTVYDPLNRFSLQLPKGWNALTPAAEAVAGATSIVNYELSPDPGFIPPPNAVKMDLITMPLAEGQSFEQWVAERLGCETTGDCATPGSQLVGQLEPFESGAYKGTTATISSQVLVKVIWLDLNDGRGLEVGLIPPDSSALPDALAVLSTLTLDQ